jgi:hypothetical protein
MRALLRRAIFDSLEEASIGPASSETCNPEASLSLRTSAAEVLPERLSYLLVRFAVVYFGRIIFSGTKRKNLAFLFNGFSPFLSVPVLAKSISHYSLRAPSVYI